MTTFQKGGFFTENNNLKNVRVFSLKLKHCSYVCGVQ